MPNRRPYLRSSRGEDATGQAGWMYTDLLLGLAVVFMATVSFLPSALPGLAPSAYVYTQHFDQIFEKTYPAGSSNPDSLIADIKTFLSVNKLPAASMIEMVQVIGGYTPGKESTADGINRAVAYSKALDKANPELLGNASTSVDSNSVLSPDTVIVRLKFGAQVR